MSVPLPGKAEVAGFDKDYTVPYATLFPTITHDGKVVPAASRGHYEDWLED